MNEPTNSELDDLMHAAMPISAHFLPVQKQKVRDFARAVLIKWGTPPAVAGEPIGYLYCGGAHGEELADWEIVADQRQCDKLNEHHSSLGKEAELPIYTVPQPTQAQAGAVPLTEAQRRAIYDEHCYLGDNGWEVNWSDVIDAVEAAHGIAGSTNDKRA